MNVSYLQLELEIHGKIYTMVTMLQNIYRGSPTSSWFTGKKFYSPSTI